MKLHDLNSRPLHIPFKQAFKHAAATRTQTHSIWVSACAGPYVGYGEGCPRSYVTGESMDSALAFFHRYRRQWQQQIQTLTDIQDWVSEHQRVIDQNPAAWCAVELALLDLLAKTQAQSIEQLLGLPPLTGHFRYTAILGDSTAETFQQQLTQYRQFGFTDFKIKASGKVDKDRQHLALIEASGHCRIRLDANNHWDNATQALQYIEQLQSPLFALEEPIAAFDFEAMAHIAQKLNIPIILDESCTQRNHLTPLAAHATHWIINLRVSKMGGLLRSLALMEAANTQQIPYIIGAFVGETSLLTRAALTLAQAAGTHCLIQEGAFGTYLLHHDICANPIMFTHGGRIASIDLPRGDGFGVIPTDEFKR